MIVRELQLCPVSICINAQARPFRRLSRHVLAAARAVAVIHSNTAQFGPASIPSVAELDRAARSHP